MNQNLEQLVHQLLGEVSHLRQQVISQQTEITRLQTSSPTILSSSPSITKIGSSRRQMLKRLAGLAGGATALAVFAPGLTLADAADGKSGVITPKNTGNPLIIGAINQPTSTTSSVDTTVLVNPSNTILATSMFTANNRSSGAGTVNAYSTAVNNYRNAIVGITSGNDNSTNPHVGVFGGVDGYGYGVVGYASDPILGVGGYFEGPNAVLQFGASSNLAGAPTSGPHDAGSIYVDRNASLYYCVFGADAGGTYRKLAGLETAGSLHLLPTPIRIVDTLKGTNLNNGGNPLNGFGSITGGDVTNVNANTKSFFTSGQGPIPPTATALTGYVYASPGYKRFTPHPGYGYLTLWEQGTPYPLASQTEGITNLTYINSTVSSSAFTVRLSASSQFSAAASVTTHIVIDVIGYYM